MEYPGWQYIQLALSIALSFLAWVITRRMQISWDRVPFVWVLTGYGAVSAISNLVRWERYDHTALRVITEDAYRQATVWWCVSLSVAVLAYLWILNRSERRVPTSTQHGAIVTRMHQSSVEVLSSYRVKFYIGVAVFLVMLYILNPFRTKDFNILMPTSVSDMALGGLLVGPFIFNTLATVAVCLLRHIPLVGLLAISAIAWLYTLSGSKGMGAMYLLYLVTIVWRHRHQRRWRIMAWPVVLGFLGLITIALPMGVRSRYGGNYTFTEAVLIAVGRFTQQDVAAVLWALPSWRESFALLYIKDNLLSFIPGFLFPAKPINPAYAINSLYFGGGGPISAASPSLFGAILIVVQDWLYWPLLLLIIFLICKSDAFFCRHPQVLDARFDYEWLYFYTLMVLFEGTFVMAFGQLLIVFIWRQLLIRQGKAAGPL